MKKQWTTPEHRLRQHRRRDYEAKRALAHAKWLRRYRQANQGRTKVARHGPSERVLRGPRCFSMTKNPEEMTSFFKLLAKEARAGRTVFVDLSQTTELTFDAIAVLLARIKERERIGVGGVKGNEPNDPKLREMLVASGFYTQIRESAYKGSASRGRMIRQGGWKVEGRVAQQLIATVTRGLTGAPSRQQGVYRILLDAMHNTFDHATPNEGTRKRWWASAYYDPASKRGYFAFVDNGIGILESVTLKGVRRVAHAMGFQSDADILRAVFEGKIESSTELDYRGHGLPGIRGVALRGAVENLVVVSNRVHADVSAEVYRVLKDGLDGTLLTWEIVA